MEEQDVAATPRASGSGSSSVDLGLTAAVHRVRMWLHERDRLSGDAVHVANGYELREGDVRRLVEYMERQPEAGFCACHPPAEGKERSDP